MSGRSAVIAAAVVGALIAAAAVLFAVRVCYMAYLQKQRQVRGVVTPHGRDSST